MRTFLRLWPYVQPYRKQMIIVVLTGAVMSATTGGVTYLVKLLFDAFDKKTDAYLWVAPAILGAYIVLGLARYLHSFLLKYSMDCIVAQIRKNLQEKFLRLTLTYHFNYRTGGAGLLSQLLNDVNIIIGGLIIVADMIREPLTILVLFGAMFYFDWQLTLFSMMFIPLLLGVLQLVTKGLKRHSTNQLQHLEDLSSSFKETLDGLRMIQSFNLEGKMKSRLDLVTDQYLKTRKSIYKREESSGPLTGVVGAAIFCGMAIFGGYNIRTGVIELGDFTGFLAAAFSLQPSIKKLQSGIVKVQQSIIATNRIMDTLENPSEVSQTKTPVEVPKDWQEIEFRNVTFKYKENTILDHLNLIIPRGSVIALVGESGSGKSTIINLLMRFFEPNEGEILIGGIPIQNFRLKDLRKEIALVSQDVFLFNDTIENNIKCGDIDGDKDVVDAAKSANAHDFISKLDKTYETKVGERGNLLSGGEKQRLSLARAFYKDAPVLVLDEATSALDSVSEQEVQKGIDQLMEGRTAIVIAHRLSTIVHADKILVLRDGKIVESGDHKSLLEKKGEYYQYFSLQANV